MKYTSNVTKEGIEVKLGQVWQDLDKRMPNHRITITEVNAGKAKGTGSKRWISICRMHRHSTGWRIISTP